MECRTGRDPSGVEPDHADPVSGGDEERLVDTIPVRGCGFTVETPQGRPGVAYAIAWVRLSQRATALVEGYLEDSRDWIVITCSMTTLTGFAASDAELRERLVPVLRLHLDSDRKAIAKRASKMLAELGETS